MALDTDKHAWLGCQVLWVMNTSSARCWASNCYNAVPVRDSVAVSRQVGCNQRTVCVVGKGGRAQVVLDVVRIVKMSE